MMNIKIYQVDAFAEHLFEGNPAAVCPLQHWINDALLQKIAAENNLSETAFFVPCDGGFELRWFTPAEEVDLCGHATLATAHVLFKHLGFKEKQITFFTKSGDLQVYKVDIGYQMNFPVSMPLITEPPKKLIDGLGIAPQEILKAYDYIVVLANENEVRSLTPEFSKWHDLDARGVVVTAKGNQADFVGRCFFPDLNINEDPVTGSAFCEMAPYWGTKLNREKLHGRQLSIRGGNVHCILKADRVFLTGNAVDYMSGEISI